MDEANSLLEQILQEYVSFHAAMKEKSSQQPSRVKEELTKYDTALCQYFGVSREPPVQKVCCHGQDILILIIYNQDIQGFDPVDHVYAIDQDIQYIKMCNHQTALNASKLLSLINFLNHNIIIIIHSMYKLMCIININF